MLDYDHTEAWEDLSIIESNHYLLEAKVKPLPIGSKINPIH